MLVLPPPAAAGTAAAGACAAAGHKPDPKPRKGSNDRPGRTLYRRLLICAAAAWRGSISLAPGPDPGGPARLPGAGPGARGRTARARHGLGRPGRLGPGRLTRSYPHLGGTALASLVICLVAYGLALRWPPLSRKPYWARQAALAVVHYLLVSLCARFAAGPPPWGWGWLWCCCSSAWASLAFPRTRLHRK